MTATIVIHETMSRSRHTDPRAIRAERRLRAPREARSEGDPALRRMEGRTLKSMGVAERPTSRARGGRATGPRIVETRPRRGFLHPTNRGDIVRALALLGPEAAYGVRTIELVHAPPAPPDALPPMGRFRTPGRILLFEQPRPPWRILGALATETVDCLERSGAIVVEDEPTGTTIVSWPGESLRDFMIVEVLLHEIGHHVLQHHKGKRTARIARTRDHEAFARAFAKRHRAAWLRRDGGE